jgi:hypothetical protein
LGTSPGVLNSQQQQQRSQIDALEKTVEGYRELVERLEGDLEKTVKGSGNHMHPYSSGLHMHHYSSGNHIHHYSSGNHIHHYGSGNHIHHYSSGNHMNHYSSGNHIHPYSSGNHIHPKYVVGPLLCLKSSILIMLGYQYMFHSFWLCSI